MPIITTSNLRKIGAFIVLAYTIRTLGTIGTLLGAVGIFLAIEAPSTWVNILLWAIISISVATMVIDALNAYKNCPSTYAPNSASIVDYMHKWLSSGGRTAIFTRDMSWAASESEAGKLLIEKAKKKELLIFVAHASEFVSQLIKYGAEVRIYAKGFTPESRFTIIDFEKHGARVAIGVVEGNSHIIRESSLTNLQLSPVLGRVDVSLLA